MNTDELTQVVTAHQNAISRHDQYETRMDRIESILERVAQQQEVNTHAIALNREGIAELKASIMELRNVVAADDKHLYYYSDRDQGRYAGGRIFFVGKHQDSSTQPKCVADTFTHLLRRVLHEEKLTFPSPEDIDDAKQQLRENFPQDYWDTYIVGLGELRLFVTINLFNSHELLYYNFYPKLSRRLPGMIVFGVYANRVLFFDPQNHLKRGK